MDPLDHDITGMSAGCPAFLPVGRGGELHLPEELSTSGQYIREFRKDKGGPGRKHPKELGVAQVKVLSVNQIAQIEVYRGWSEGF